MMMALFSPWSFPETAIASRLIRPQVSDGQIGEFWRPGEYVCHRRLHGFESFLAARILLAGAGFFLAFEHGQDVGLIRVLLVPHEHLTDQARSGLLGGPEVHGRLGQVLARLQSHLDQLRPHIASLLDRAIRSATPRTAL